MESFATKFITKEPLPLVIEPKKKGQDLETFLGDVREHQDELKKEILRYGGLLFRNCPIAGIEDFIQLQEALGTGEAINYAGGGAPRLKVKKSVYTSTEAPPALTLFLHNEMSYVRDYPSHIYFYCQVAPQQGGETFIADARKIYEALDPEVRDRMIEKQLKYTSRYYHESRLMDLMNKIQRGHKTWIDVFETEDKGEVEEKCKANDFDLKWLGNDWLQLDRTRPATITHPVTGEKVWFCQPHLFDYNPRFLGWLRYIGLKLFYCRKDTLVDEVSYADGTPIPREDIYHILDVLQDQSIYFPWQEGDVMVLDNVLAMHGRAPFTGKRRILTAMTR